jgi:hypothetical protein
VQLEAIGHNQSGTVPLRAVPRWAAAGALALGLDLSGQRETGVIITAFPWCRRFGTAAMRTARDRLAHR